MSAVLEVLEPSARYLEMRQPLLMRRFGLLAGASDGVARLRELVLSLAVQGKLVPQDPDDKPARQLLQTIVAAKARLGARATSQPEEPLGAAIDQSPYEIPDAWTWVPLGAVVEIVRGITFPASEKTKDAAPGRIACLRTANVQTEVEWDDLLFVNRSFLGRDEQLLRLHDIVMSMANSRELVGKVALVDHIPHEEATFGGFLGILRPWKVEPRYVMAFLRSTYARSTLIDSSSQTTNIANISLGKLRPLLFPLPPLAEQARIAARVDELMRLCDALEAKGRLEAEQHARLLGSLLGTLTDSATPEELTANWQRVAVHFDLLLDRPEAVDALEQTILNLAVRGLLAPQDPRDEPAPALVQRIRDDRAQLVDGRARARSQAGDAIAADEVEYAAPPGWIWIRFGEISINRDGERVPVSADDRERRAKVYDYYGASGVIDKIDGYLFDKTLLLIGEDGANLLNRSTPIAYLAHGRYWVNNHAHVIDTTHPELMQYLELFINAISLEPYVTGTAQPKMNQAKLNSIPVALPPLAEQLRILRRVAELRRLCIDLRQRLAASQTTQCHVAAALVEQAASA